LTPFQGGGHVGISQKCLVWLDYHMLKKIRWSDKQFRYRNVTDGKTDINIARHHADARQKSSDFDEIWHTVAYLELDDKYESIWKSLLAITQQLIARFQWNLSWGSSFGNGIDTRVPYFYELPRAAAFVSSPTQLFLVVSRFETMQWWRACCNSLVFYVGVACFLAASSCHGFISGVNNYDRNVVIRSDAVIMTPWHATQDVMSRGEIANDIKRTYILSVHDCIDSCDDPADMLLNFAACTSTTDRPTWCTGQKL